VRRPTPADDEVGDVELAVRACPTQALALVD
jgi:ferredoxin